MIVSLGFRVETISGARVKIRDDGRRGPCVADEAVLWDALQTMQYVAAERTLQRDVMDRQRTETLAKCDALEVSKLELESHGVVEHEDRLNAEKERDQLKIQCQDLRRQLIEAQEQLELARNIQRAAPLVQIEEQHRPTPISHLAKGKRS